VKLHIVHDENGELNFTPTPKLPRMRSGPPTAGWLPWVRGTEEAEANKSLQGDLKLSPQAEIINSKLGDVKRGLSNELKDSQKTTWKGCLSLDL
jgi:hypothetical protein